ncbi:hypothetical protein HYH03_005618 [Edaphochlamys debaryana]|uniref:Uncharacterized protein n=1 Tax=Edaphochlamys debaryana TaxID=47281 RepID=A0A836C0Z7_9CHLO|nr:hypothetical protein HYH03_005618 [Edaphochlamys debaryana]|eukprot:KAG2496391.1 hypothetical protein HYH03_005618 [Edaphochlamys debaryana]
MAEYVDIGPLLQAARVEMKVGQLISGEAFSLFEAMSALEAGNPKMDAAASPAAARPSLDALLADPKSFPLDLSGSQLLAVLDGLIAMEAAWHSGGSPMQTVYACLYMLQINRVRAHGTPATAALGAYCLALQADCAAVRDLIIAGAVCEEEDMNVFTAGIPFEPAAAPEGGREAALAALDAATAAADAAATAGSDPHAAALAARLRFRKALSLGLAAAAGESPEEVRSAAARFAEAREQLPAIRESAAPEPPPPAAPAVPLDAKARAAAAAAAAALGPPAPGFCMDVNRHLLGPAPPRQVQLLTVSQSLSYFDKLLGHLELAVGVTEAVHDYRSLQLFLWRFARQGPGSVSRSLLHWMLLPERWKAKETPEEAQPAASASGSAPALPPRKKGGKGAAANGTGAAAAKKEAPAPSVEPPWVPSKRMIAAACQLPYKEGLPEEAELFYEQSVIAVSNWAQAVLMNRCRSRRRLRRCLDDWANMYHHGYNAEVVPAVQAMVKASGWRWPIPSAGTEGEISGPMTTWVEYETAGTMLHHLLLGFEQELYEPHEYDMIYWYCDYLCTAMINAFSQTMQLAPPAQPPKVPPSAAGGAGGRGLGRGLGGRGRGREALRAEAENAAARFELEQVQLRFAVVEVEAMQQLCQGMLRLMVGLKMAGCISQPHPPPFNGQTERFEQRFAAFGQLMRPLPLTPQEFVASMDPQGRGAGDMLALASRQFKEARNRMPMLRTYAPSPDVADGWVKGLEAAAGLNAVASGVLAARLADGPVKVDLDWSRHPYFPAVTLPKAVPPAAAAKSS